MTRIHVLILIATALVACGKTKEQAPAAGSAIAPAPVAADAAAGSGSAQAVDQPLDVPTEVDFEDTAANDITDKNVEAKIKQLESDLGQ